MKGRKSGELEPSPAGEDGEPESEAAAFANAGGRDGRAGWEVIPRAARSSRNWSKLRSKMRSI